MNIRIIDIPPEGLSIEAEIPKAAFPVLSEIVRSGECAFLTPLHLQATAKRTKDVVEVAGRLRIRLQLACSRCLAEYESDLETDFTLTYIPEMSTSDSAALEAGDCLPYSGEKIDLTEGLQEALVMALPRKPLCKPSCKGLCAGCGVNLNEEACRCEPAVDPRLAALKNFKVK